MPLIRPAMRDWPTSISAPASAWVLPAAAIMCSISLPSNNFRTVRTGAAMGGELLRSISGWHAGAGPGSATHSIAEDHPEGGRVKLDNQASIQEDRFTGPESHEDDMPS